MTPDALAKTLAASIVCTSKEFVLRQPNPSRDKPEVAGVELFHFVAKESIYLTDLDLFIEPGDIFAEQWFVDMAALTVRYFTGRSDFSNDPPAGLIKLYVVKRHD